MYRITLLALVCFSSIINLQAQLTIDFIEKVAGVGATNGRKTGDGFGASVAVSGDIMVVGASSQSYDSAGANNATSAGAAYVYYNISGTWQFIKKLTGASAGLNGRNSYDYFGTSVAISGDIIIVGASYQDYDSAGGTNVSNTGAVYVFYKNKGGSNTWGFVKKITGIGINGRVSGDSFGASIAVSDDVIIVGAFQQDYDSVGSNVSSNAGAVYVFNKNSGGVDNWGFVKKITGASAGTNGRQASDYFGYSVAMSNDIMVVGADFHDYDSAGANSIINAGAVYIFYRNSGGIDNWGFIKKITGIGINGRVSSDLFGYSVSLSNDVIVVGALQQSYDSAGGNNISFAGAAYIFYQNSGGVDNWGFVKKLTGVGVNSRISGDGFGNSVAVFDDVIVVGANYQDYDDTGGTNASDAGAAYVYYRNSGGADNWGNVTKLTGNSAGTNGRIANDYFGFSLAMSSDFIVVGAFFQSYDSIGGNYQLKAGAAYVYGVTFTLIYNGSSWTPNAPDNTTSDKNAIVTSGNPVLPNGAIVKNLTLQNGTGSTINPSETFNIQGSYTNNGVLNGGGNLILIGSSAQIIYGSGITSNLEVNNSSGVSISSSASDSLKISGVLTHTAGALTTNNKLKLVATGATTYGQIAGIGSGTINGNIIAEYQVLTGNEGWRPISSPLNGATLAQLTDDLPINFDLPYTTIFTFNESRSPVWQIPTSNASMADSCFSVYIGKNGAWGVPVYLDITGTYNGTTDYTQNNLTYTGATSDTSGWHYMRNPWPSGFLWDGTISNIQGNQIYLYDQNGGAGGFYHVYDNINQGVVPPFSALLFQLTANNVSVTLPNSKRNTDSLKNVFDKTFSADNYIELGVQKDGQPVTDYLKFYTDAAAKNTFDALDGIKKLNDPTMPSIYFTTGADKLNKQVYNAIPMGTTKLPFMFITTINGKYILNPRIENLAADVEVFIENLQTNTLTAVNTVPITINYTGDGVASRYNLVFSKKSTNSSIQTVTNTNTINMAQADDVLFINANLPANTQITVTDILGRVMVQKTIQDATQGITQIDVAQLATGYYIVTLNGDTIHYSQKIVVK